jgi:hypothetical protein
MIPKWCQCHLSKYSIILVASFIYRSFVNAKNIMISTITMSQEIMFWLYTVLPWVQSHLTLMADEMALEQIFL